MNIEQASICGCDELESFAERTDHCYRNMFVMGIVSAHNSRPLFIINLFQKNARNAHDVRVCRIRSVSVLKYPPTLRKHTHAHTLTVIQKDKSPHSSAIQINNANKAKMRTNINSFV